MSSPMSKLLPPVFRGRRHLLSGTATTARQAIGSHLHQIEGSVATGEAVRSSPFLVGGRWWQLVLYPNGVDSGHRGFVSADLTLAPDDDHLGATASYRVSILDEAGHLAHSAAVGPRRFCGRYDYRPSEWRPFGQPKAEAAVEEELLGKTAIERLVAAGELRRSAPLLVRNEFLHVQCDVAVTEMDTKPLGKWFMRVARARLS